MLIASLLWCRVPPPSRTPPQSRTRSTVLPPPSPACHVGALLAAVAQPGVSPGLSAVVHLHDSAQTFIYLDTGYLRDHLDTA